MHRADLDIETHTIAGEDPNHPRASAKMVAAAFTDMHTNLRELHGTMVSLHNVTNHTAAKAAADSVGAMLTKFAWAANEMSRRVVAGDVPSDIAFLLDVVQQRIEHWDGFHDRLTEALEMPALQEHGRGAIVREAIQDETDRVRIIADVWIEAGALLRALASQAQAKPAAVSAADAKALVVEGKRQPPAESSNGG